MKIIKVGTPPKKSWLHTCSKCGSELEFSRTDVKENHDPRDGWHETYINCPVCKSQQTVQTPEL